MLKKLTVEALKCKHCNTLMSYGIAFVPYRKDSRHCLPPSYKLDHVLKCHDCGFSRAHRGEYGQF